ncbi:DUF771 domain-containing protein [Paenilisteria rocourtiae]|uniref:Uncharacterized protein DUF771 n=1 Tax=Listeria rocourtiae TaxID=647910 RepID=A0A4R6ZNI6_9LIST|nr:DUF771 domain-containing protein [Listeria rocourtiae]EUJ51558.1 hypothetical protein PROCOU_01664 [Listeria rocourtiae FSL F6-920]TDR53689.1 uncharacterized protein DUF771 [Listeria rocourtiae]
MSLIEINKNEVRKILKEILKEILEEEGLIGLIWKMERMQLECGGQSKDWIVDHICHHPYVVRHELASKDGKSWIFKAKRMDEFIDMYFPELHINHKNEQKRGVKNA